MTPPRNRIVQGDALEKLCGWPADIAQLCITSPPYWQQREYRNSMGVALPGQWGREPTLETHVAALVELGREVRRVLRDDGMFVLNYGEGYSSGGRASYDASENQNKGQTAAKGLKRPAIPSGLKPKDLLGLPWRIALALQADGWYWRSYSWWNKLNGMPDSVTDRPGLGHEIMLMFSKRRRYFWDPYAIRVRYAAATIARADGSHVTTSNPDVQPGFLRTVKSNKQRGHSRRHAGFNDRWDLMEKAKQQASGRSRKMGDWSRDGLPLLIAQVRAWADHAERFHRGQERILLDFDGLLLEQRLPTFGYPGAHFATFPPDLVRPFIRAATSERGACPACGAPWVRCVEHPGRSGEGWHYHTDDAGRGASQGSRPRVPSPITTGWRPSCACDAGEPIPQLVLDPFIGSGTVGVVAVQEGRDWLGIDLSGGDQDFGGHTAHERIAAAAMGIPLAELIDGREYLAALREAGQLELIEEETF